ncbi:hypothetical protein MLD38_023268 [Melastoma candidum]|uniref:Uncharacterized protein n=1 Tax=Melastoma candidum TaxID=119954 RepID=A0ACB9QN60_9MYRT|nr:hypothetical protein MLD38_023268 [Melastoma candidum]
MDPCPFLRILVGNLALKLPPSDRRRLAFFCRVKVKGLPPKESAISVLSSEEQFATVSAPGASVALAAVFSLDKSEVDRLVVSQKGYVKVEVYKGGKGLARSCGFGGSGKLLGKVKVPVDLKKAAGESKSGWVGLGRKGSGGGEVHVSVRTEADPRFVFRFEKEPECSPLVYQVQGSVKQPVFTCKFSFRNTGVDRSRSSLSETSTSSSCIPSLTKEQDRQWKERKGWSVTIHDLSGSPVAAASMVTPFVPSPGTDRVSRSNPGAWLVLRPGYGTWKPWGRLEAWCDRGPNDLSYRFELLPDTSAPYAAVATAASTVSIRSGGKFTLDTTTGVSPASSPGSSMDLGTASWSGSGSEPGPGALSHLTPAGFVMSAAMGGVDERGTGPEVEVGVQNVTCTEDAAAFVALGAALDLSMDACRLFSQKLRTELRQQGDEFSG